MEKKIYVDERAKKELENFDLSVQKVFRDYNHILSRIGKLDPPEGKKLERNLFEIRIMVDNAYRGIYAYVQSDFIVILHYFQKKTQKTPKRI